MKKGIVFLALCLFATFCWSIDTNTSDVYLGTESHSFEDWTSPVTGSSGRSTHTYRFYSTGLSTLSFRYYLQGDAYGNWWILLDGRRIHDFNYVSSWGGTETYTNLSEGEHTLECYMYNDEDGTNGNITIRDFVITQNNTGSIGNVNWEYNKGVLRFSGSGNISGFGDMVSCPWHAVRNNITYVMIPAGVTTIGLYAFNELSNLNTFVCSATTPPTVSSGAFDGTNQNNVALWVPSSSVETYKAAYGWNWLAWQSLGGFLNTCGNSVICAYENGTLSIIGTGAMKDYENRNLTPWFSLYNNITKVEIQEGVTSIGAYTFNSYPYLREVSLPSTLKKYGTYALYNTSNLKAVYIHFTDPSQVSVAGNGPHFGSAIKYVPCGSNETFRSKSLWSSNLSDNNCPYERTTTIGKYGTMCVPRAVKAEDIHGAIFYNIHCIMKNNEDVITHLILDEVEGDLEAGKSYIFRATETEMELTYFGMEKMDAEETMGLVGNLRNEDIEVPQGEFILSNNQIRQLAGGYATVGKNRAYLNLTNVPTCEAIPAESPKRISLHVEAEQPISTGIKQAISTDIQKMLQNGNLIIRRNDCTYDVMGRKIQK